MKNLVIALFFIASILPCYAQQKTPEALERDIAATLKPFESMGKKNFETKWKNGGLKEVYQVEGKKISYTKFYPAGNAAVTYQRAASGVIVYERKYSDDKDAILIKKDERILDYTSYWPSGLKKEKYQKNFQTKKKFYIAHDEKGVQVYPKSK